MDLAMSLAEYSQHDGLALAELVRNKEVSAEELARIAAAAVAATNPKLNAVIEVWHDRVEKYDAEANLDGPFGGVPFFIKDFGVCEAGRLQECGSRLFEGNVAAETSELAKKFKRAGLNMMGRTTLPDNGFSFHSESVLHGRTHNPWDLDHIAGGSSSGSSAAVAAGVVPMASASDGGGSTRIPASICGLVGLKPSRGRLSMAPLYSESLIPEGVEGVVTRTVRDTAVLFDHISGSEVGEFMHAAPPTRPYAVELTDPAKYRIAVTLDAWGPYDAPPHIMAEVGRTAHLLEEMGHEVVQATPTIEFEAFYEDFTLHWIGHTLEFKDVAEESEISLEDGLEPMLYQHVVKAREYSLRQWLAKEHTLIKVTRDLDAFFRDNGFDLALTPVMAIDTPPFDTLYGLNHTEMPLEEWITFAFGAVPYTPLCNATGVPAISLPLAEDGNGLPLGMHFFGRWGSEDKLINLAAQLEQAKPWIDKRPPVHVAKIA